jgi:hypothetical protein
MLVVGLVIKKREERTLKSKRDIHMPSMKAQIKEILDSGGDSDVVLGMLKAISPDWARILHTPDHQNGSDKKSPDTDFAASPTASRHKVKVRREVPVERIKPAKSTKYEPAKPRRSEEEVFVEELRKKAASWTRVELAEGSIVITRYPDEISVKYIHLIKNSKCEYYYHTCRSVTEIKRWPNMTCINCPKFLHK